MTAIAAASTRPPAEVYENEFVPALFRPFSPSAAGVTTTHPLAERPHRYHRRTVRR